MTTKKAQRIAKLIEMLADELEITATTLLVDRIGPNMDEEDLVMICRADTTGLKVITTEQNNRLTMFEQAVKHVTEKNESSRSFSTEGWTIVSNWRYNNLLECEEYMDSATKYE
jgi:hypothetical protein